HEELKAELEKFKDSNGRYDAEAVLYENPALVDKIADAGLIPRNMFYAYNMEALLKMESPSGQEPPGVTYFEAGNRTRRLDALLASGTKIFLRGGIGTDEEFEETIRQHVEARKRKLGKGGHPPVANDTAFSDGTPDTDGTIIVYNKAHSLDKLLAHYGLLGEDPVALAKRETYKIKVVTELADLRDVVSATATKWQNRIKRSDTPASNMSQAV
ncbi:MAG: hypothetical protein EBV03_08500, partial [Proteobacteria bacterium]|nr:hypothetical protein [Pseudomonadota bacterium]